MLGCPGTFVVCIWYGRGTSDTIGADILVAVVAVLLDRVGARAMCGRELVFALLLTFVSFLVALKPSWVGGRGDSNGVTSVVAV